MMGSHRVGHDWSDLAVAAASCVSAVLGADDKTMNRVAVPHPWEAYGLLGETNEK